MNLLEHDSLSALEWFECNHMKLNEDKCDLLTTGHKYEHVLAKEGEAETWESSCEKPLGINIDCDLSFNYRVSNLSIKTGRKVKSTMSFDQWRLLMKSFIESQFSYSPLMSGCFTTEIWTIRLINYSKVVTVWQTTRGDT